MYQLLEIIKWIYVLQEQYKLLSDVKGEVESVIATGRKIVKEEQTIHPDELTTELDHLKALYNQLGSSVTEQRGILEAGLRHSRKLEKDSDHLEEWLTSTETELDYREASIPTKSVQQEITFAQVG